MQSTLACAFAASLAAAWWYYRQQNDPYGLFHLSFNQRPGEDEAKTEWLNMGYWRDTNVFPDACQALALKLVQIAQCREKGKVLDVGHGTGESLILLLTHSSVPRPSHLVGITSIPLHHRRSVERSQRLATPGTELSLHVGDAIFRTSSSLDHPFNPSSHNKFDTIIALDCAYHFKTRDEFLRQSFYHLERGGRIALADICFADSLPMNWRARLSRQFLRLMPKENAISIQEYVQGLEEIGFQNVEIEDISSDVFPGFMQFLKSRGLGWSVFGIILHQYYLAGARFVLCSGTRTE